MLTKKWKMTEITAGGEESTAMNGRRSHVNMVVENRQIDCRNM
jgi:hypothetical protein